jgi:GIY-YIG catalytic domain.
MIGIYKITKISNGKSYIGQSNNIERRFQEHKTKKDIPIEIAI